MNRSITKAKGMQLHYSFGENGAYMDQRVTMLQGSLGLQYVSFGGYTFHLDKSRRYKKDGGKWCFHPVCSQRTDAITLTCALWAF